ncbi:MAG: hypothetical protein HY319_15890 [Armatimonadetes bacterium]|nr:hypothetical protein [Armatimonadota bacterium]
MKFSSTVAVLLVILVGAIPAVAADPDLTAEIQKGGAPWARVASDGTVYVEGQPRGKIGPDGRVLVEGQAVGSVTPGGVIHKDGADVGYLSAKGDIVVDGALVGAVSSSGNILLRGAQWGYAPNCAGMDGRRLVATVVLFFADDFK